VVYGGDFWAMETDIQKNYDGWYRRLETSGTDASERIVSKPTVLGGMVLVPAFTPDANICSFGGITNLYGLYFATGTGYIKQIFNIDTPDTVTVDGNPENVIEVKMPGSLVGTPPPGAGMHAGQEVGAKAFLQQSSGQMAVVEVVPPFYFQSALIDWWE
jgi:type IV pilus assembly protein PilY1